MRTLSSPLKIWGSCLIACALFAGPASFSSDLPPGKPEVPGKIDFNRDVRPVLSANCFQCHGPDKAARKAKLRLDTRVGATADLNGDFAIVPGNIEKSQLYKRIVSTDPEEQMPPPKSAHSVTPVQIQILKRWIEQNAPYAEHWAFIRTLRPEIPAVKSVDWPKNKIDQFILARLEKEGLRPSPQADRYALVRRLSLDLTGLPPTPEEVQAFVEDKSPDAYEKLVDRFMASPSYGERWARMWLDLARYADSAGYGSDPLRLNIWPYRDWVIDAFNRNLPYDQFTVNQIAGDLLPNPTPNQMLASAFHRNTMTNTEGGTDDEEFRVAAVKDRANVTGQVWMGLTVGCAQCHSHKYDPIEQKEYYQLYAFFNQTEDNDQPDESPRKALATPSQEIQIGKLKSQIADLEQQLNSPSPQLQTEQAEWEKKTATESIAWTVLNPSEAKSTGGAKLTVQADQSILASEKSPATDTYTIKAPVSLKHITGLRLEALPDESLPKHGSGRGANGEFALSDFSVNILPAKSDTMPGRFVHIENTGKQKYLSLAEVQVFSAGQNIALKGKATQSSIDYEGPPNLAIDGNTNGDFNAAKSVTHTKLEDNPWWEVDLGATADLEQIVIWNRTDGGTHTRLSDFNISVLDSNRKPVWQKKVAAPPNPSSKFELTGGRQVVLSNPSADFSTDGWPVEKALSGDPKSTAGWSLGADSVNPRSAVFESNTEIGEAGGVLNITLSQNAGQQRTLGRFRFSVTAQAGPLRLLPASITRILGVPAAQRNENDKKEIAAYFRTLAPALAKIRGQIAEINSQIAALKPTEVPIMKELPANKRRTTHLMNKGNFLTPGDVVEAGLPAAFHPMPKDAPMNRLGLAQWLMAKENPLTARVAVNRFWAQIFGIGIVESEEDFGTQGTLPSHPELLDWMAVEFAENGWDMKALVKMIVTSATYQQSSRLTPELLEKDPRNRLLTRSPRRRLDAETVRDQALALSGLLSPKIGGPSVFPPQPDGLWRAAFNGERTWSTSKGEDRYRRGIYTFWRRTVPYPSMATFDQPSREICTVRRIATNTPLQAFVTLNDPVYVEAAQALARRIAAQGGKSIEERVKFGLSLCLARVPKDEQIKGLVTLYQSELDHFKGDVAAAQKMATDPLGALPAGADAAEMAAWTVVANVLLNLDGVLCR